MLSRGFIVQNYCFLQIGDYTFLIKMLDIFVQSAKNHHFCKKSPSFCKKSPSVPLPCVALAQQPSRYLFDPSPNLSPARGEGLPPILSSRGILKPRKVRGRDEPLTPNL